MKKHESSETNDEMRPAYDFRGAVRGRYYKPLHEGYTLEVHKDDGTTLVQQYKLEEGTVLLEPDVRAWFPDSAAVNQALRSLIILMEQMPKKGKTKKTQKETSLSVSS
jgi:hypothetical protein